MNELGKAELSIVMPVFNRKELVRIMIDSILANTYKNWELLAIDDGSIDGTYELLCEYALEDKRVKPYLRTELPKGAQTCRNKGLELAEGEYIVFFDSDDYISPLCLQERVEHMKNNPNMDFLVFPFGSYEDMQNGVYKVKGGFPLPGNDLDRFICRKLPFCVWSNIYRIDSLNIYGINWDVNLKSLQDADFNMSALLSGLQYNYVQTRIDYFVRQGNNGDSISKQIVTKEHFQSNIYALEKFYLEIQNKYGNSKNKQLYDGVIWLYDRISRNLYAFEFVKQLYRLVAKYDKRRSNYIRLIMYVHKLLFYTSLFSPNTARRIVLFPYLLRSYISNAKMKIIR